ncbi:hypothetical protein MLD38_030813 [Melastoma candidum]|uniref:Uncharacterized protein n=1 Tax=Melastoma candidum TaxID=119954 RepID=A0ACB9MNB9_9MYRT|nr:hypothetical protein MLD38_030813 [Melastoma candidum]
MGSQVLGFAILLVAAGMTVALPNKSMDQMDVPAIFVFGDSTADVGTNNHLKTVFRADFPYYGIDFDLSKATGRFSNGYNTIDEISMLLGFHQSPSPYLSLASDQSTFKKNIFLGANFASAGSGILDSTGSQLGVIPMRQQVEQFRLVRNSMMEVIGATATSGLLSKSLFIITAGGNDIIDYFKSNMTTISQQDYMESIISNYTAHLTNLHIMGARKFGVISSPPVGCLPSVRLQANLTLPGSGCQEGINEYARGFHGMLTGLLRGLSSDLNGMVYSLGDVYNMTITMMQDPLAFGFTNVEEACCGGGRLNAETRCLAMQYPSPNVCKDRGAYLFWDSYHPTEHACKLAAKTLVGAGLAFVAPMNFGQLAQTKVQDE